MIFRRASFWAGLKTHKNIILRHLLGRIGLGDGDGALGMGIGDGDWGQGLGGLGPSVSGGMR